MAELLLDSQRWQRPSATTTKFPLNHPSTPVLTSKDGLVLPEKSKYDLNFGTKAGREKEQPQPLRVPNNENRLCAGPPRARKNFGQKWVSSGIKIGQYLNQTWDYQKNCCGKRIAPGHASAKGPGASTTPGRLSVRSLVSAPIPTPTPKKSFLYSRREC